MNQNDILAQQQALLNQALNQQHHLYWAAALFYVVGLAVTGWVLYMFYARLRDIAHELKKLRIAYESSHSSLANAPANQHSESAQVPSSTDYRYMPKK